MPTKRGGYRGKPKQKLPLKGKRRAWDRFGGYLGKGWF